MQDIKDAQSVPETVNAGLRMLARIIAREAVKVQFANRDEVDPDGLHVSSLQIEVVAERTPRTASLASEDGEIL